jgi:hypothetical protein
VDVGRITPDFAAQDLDQGNKVNLKTLLELGISLTLPQRRTGHSALSVC